MEQQELSLVRKLDIGLTKGFSLLLVWLKNISLWLLGLAMLLGSITMIFEYGEGLADISGHEWIFMLLLPLLLWRHVLYCKHFTVGFWRGLSRLLIAQGILGVLFTLIYGLAIFSLWEGEDLNSFIVNITQESPADKLVDFGLVLLTIYLATPVSTDSHSTKYKKSPRVEPSVSLVTEEASQ